MAFSNCSLDSSSWPTRKSRRASARCGWSASCASTCAASTADRTSVVKGTRQRIQASAKRKGGRRSGPLLTRELWRLEPETDADAKVERRLVLRGRARQQRVHRLAEIGVGGAGAQLRVLIVAVDAPLVEQVERFGHEREPAAAGELQRPGGLQIQLAFERRALQEAVDRLDARSTSGHGNFARAVVVRVRRHRRQRLA